MADPDLELRGGGGDLDFLVLLAFSPLVISSFFTQNKGGGGGGLKSDLCSNDNSLQAFQEWYETYHNVAAYLVQ